MTTTATTSADDALADLTKLVELSKKHPNKFDWKKNLNEWQILFVDYIIQVSRHVQNFKLTPKQQAKVAECLERMTLV